MEGKGNGCKVLNARGGIRFEFLVAFYPIFIVIMYSYIVYVLVD